MSKTILLTGAAGFIGAQTAQALLGRGDQVIGVDNLNDYYSVQLKKDRLARLKSPRFTFHELDIANTLQLAKALEGNKIDAICHLAAQAGVRYSLEKPLTYIQSNLLGSTVIFELAKITGINQIVYASSSSVYGNNPQTPFREDQKIDRPISLYAATKAGVELLAHTYNHLYKIKMTGLRFFTVYGPWGRPDMAPIKFAKAISAGETIDVYNHGKMQRDFTYIDDIVRGIVSSLNRPLEDEIINLGGSQVTELEYFIALLEKEFGKKAKKNYLPLQPGDVLTTAADTSKAKSLLDWTPQVNLEEGVSRFCQWFSRYYSPVHA